MNTILLTLRMTQSVSSNCPVYRQMSKKRSMGKKMQVILTNMKLDHFHGTDRIKK